MLSLCSSLETPQESPDAEWELPVEWSYGTRWGFGMWAEAFRYLPSLKSVTIDFHTRTERTKVLEGMVWLASNTWRFPLGPRPDDFTYLSAQGNPVRKTSWRGAPNLTPAVWRVRTTAATLK